jgi:uncharacterized protein YkwD
MPARDPGHRRAAPRRGGRPLALSAVFAAVSLAAAVFLAGHLPSPAGPTADRTAAVGHAGSRSAAPPRPGSLAASTPTGPAGPAPGHPRHPAQPAHRAHPASTARRAHPAPRHPSATPGPGRPHPGASTAAIAQVLALINQARAQAGRPALTVSAGLGTSAARHNAVMAAGCGLSHQCPGEPALGDRETAAGVRWAAAGENIGGGGPVPDSSAAIARMAAGLTQSMLNERPPGDGHRANILNGSFRHIGIAVARDGAGTVWLTQDFSN